MATPTKDQTPPFVTTMIDQIIKREGGYSNRATDRGGPTMYGITERVARNYGYTGDMRDLPRETAFTIYLDLYYLAPHFDDVAERSQSIAEELVDTGVNCGPGRAAEFLQRALNVFNLRGKYWPDLKVDNDIGPATLAALNAYLAKRGAPGVVVMVRTLNALQAAFYFGLAERDQSQEDYVYGWMQNRVA